MKYVIKRTHIFHVNSRHRKNNSYGRCNRYQLQYMTVKLLNTVFMRISGEERDKTQFPEIILTFKRVVC